MGGSSYFGEAGETERGSSSRKGRKNNNNYYSSSGKPRQPQRGLGVAQLEKIRLHSQMAYASYHHHHLLHASYPTSNLSNMGLSEYQKTNIRYNGDYRSTNTSRLEQSNATILENPHHSNMMTIPFLNLYGSHDDIDMNKKHRSGSMGSSSSQNSESSDTRELVDLELRLSL